MSAPLDVRIRIPQRILTGIFDECDKYEAVETGGRVLGFYNLDGCGNLIISVRALIGAGPNARRSSTSFFQDGDYQERIFRAVEKQHPTIAHLGNWHTHHPNGLQVLSQGDCDTYHRTVNHPNHAQDFFYALLVTSKDIQRRYTVKHYVVFRADSGVYRIHEDDINVTDRPVLQLA